ncbi:MAG: methyltransferase domain-containing protein [Chloroflexi bacterium]|nr:methyltransferase domain-containing protein [Chloroflexota bacterium]
MASELWKSEALVHQYLTGVRGAIPLAAEQIDVMLRVVDSAVEDLRSIADLGCGGGVLSAALLERHPQARATLVDFSEPMIAEAKSSRLVR